MKQQEETSENFEARLSRLQEIITLLESGSVPLEQSVTLYKEGAQLAQTCRRQLDQARNDIRICSEGVLQPFTEESGEQHDSSSGSPHDVC